MYNPRIAGMDPKMDSGDLLALLQAFQQCKRRYDERLYVHRSLAPRVEQLHLRLKRAFFQEDESMFELLYDNTVREAYRFFLLRDALPAPDTKKKKKGHSAISSLIAAGPGKWFSSSKKSAQAITLKQQHKDGDRKATHPRPPPSSSSSFSSSVSLIDDRTRVAVKQLAQDFFRGPLSGNTMLDHVVTQLTTEFRIQCDISDNKVLVRNSLQARVVMHALALSTNEPLFHDISLRVLETEMKPHKSAPAFLQSVRRGHFVLPFASLHRTESSPVNKEERRVDASLFRAMFFLRLFRQCAAIGQSAFEGPIHTLCASRMRVSGNVDSLGRPLLDIRSAYPEQKDWLHNTTLLFCTYADSLLRALVEMQAVLPREVHEYLHLALNACERRWGGLDARAAEARARYVVASLLYSSFLLPMLAHADALVLLPNLAHKLDAQQTELLLSVTRFVNALLLRCALGRIGEDGEWEAVSLGPQGDDCVAEDIKIPELFAVAPDMKMVAKLQLAKYWSAQMRKGLLHVDHLVAVCRRHAVCPSRGLSLPVSPAVEENKEAVVAAAPDAAAKVAVLSLVQTHALYCMVAHGGDSSCAEEPMGEVEQKQQRAFTDSYALLARRLKTLIQDGNARECVLVTIDAANGGVAPHQEPAAYLEWASDNFSPQFLAEDMVWPLFELFSLVEADDALKIEQEGKEGGHLDAGKALHGALRGVLEHLESLVGSSIAPTARAVVQGRVGSGGSEYSSWKGKTNMVVMIQTLKNRLRSLAGTGRDVGVRDTVLEGLKKLLVQLEPALEAHWRERLQTLETHLNGLERVIEVREFHRDHVANLLYLKQSHSFFAALDVHMDIRLVLKGADSSSSPPSSSSSSSSAKKKGKRDDRFICKDMDSFIVECRRQKDILRNDEVLTSKVYHGFQRLCAQKMAAVLKESADRDGDSAITVTTQLKNLRRILEARLGSALYPVLFNSLELVSTSNEPVPLALKGINMLAVPMLTSLYLRPSSNQFCGLDRQFMRKSMAASAWVSPVELELPQRNLPKTRPALVRIFRPALRTLQSMSLMNNCSAVNKLRALKQCSQIVESVFAMGQSLLAPKVCDADTLLSGVVLVLLLLDTPIPLPSTLAFIRSFSVGSEISGAEQYCLVTFELAMRYILELSEFTVAEAKREQPSASPRDVLTNDALPVCRHVLSFLTHQELRHARSVCRTWQMLGDAAVLFYRFQHMSSSASQASIARLQSLSDARTRAKSASSVSLVPSTITPTNPRRQQRPHSHAEKKQRVGSRVGGRLKSMKLVAPLKQTFNFDDKKAMGRLLVYSQGIYTAETVMMYLQIIAYKRTFKTMDVFAQLAMSKHIFTHYIQEGAEHEVFLPSRLRAELKEVLDLASATGERELQRAEEARKTLAGRVSKLAKAVNPFTKRRGARVVGPHGLSAHTFDELLAHAKREILLNIVPRFCVYESQVHMI